ncbi:MAG TPA: hypothetical protein VKX17_23195 [Planctomycetota bacterium]|nr:hypothetical protein [Planctomycetota bacterium]
MTTRLLACLTLLLCAALRAEDEKGKWLPLSDGIVAKLAKDNLKIGYPGLTAGVAADRVSGDVYVVVCDQGLWKSSDKGANFERVDGKAISGRCETGFALDFDPNGQRLMCFMIYGSPARTLDGGKTWTKSKLQHLDFGATDWSDPEAKTMLAIKHESGGELVLTSDGAQSWTSLGKGFKAVGVFDATTFVASKGKGILRSTDAGKTWTDASPSQPAGLSMRVFKGAGYWTTDKGVLVSKDKGATWSVLGSAVNAYYGPYFGEDEKHLVVVGKDGIQETKDAGATWKVVAPLPDGFKVGFTGPNFAWDPKADVFYASTMGKPAFKFQR